ncbi:MAG: hypothetical protein J1E81_06190 [Eubacterium sp.]|nr:hypothetical protein [Eubacterium sp.]
MALKVNVDKLLADYNALVEKQEKKLGEIDTFAVGIAKQRGWDEDRTARFVEFMESEENNGLSEDDGALLNILDAYVDEVAAEAAEEEPVEQPANPTAPNPAAVNVV